MLMPYNYIMHVPNYADIYIANVIGSSMIIK